MWKYLTTFPTGSMARPPFANYLTEVIASLASASFGFRQPSCRMYSDEVGIVNAHDMFTGVTKDGKTLSIHGRTTLVFIKQSGQWKIVSAHFSAIPKALCESSHGIWALGGAP